MKNFKVMFFIFSILLLSFGTPVKDGRPKPMPIRPTPHPGIRINISGLDNNITKHIQILDSIININKANIISRNIQIDSSNIVINYDISFIYYIAQDKAIQDNTVKDIKNEFKGLNVGYNESSGYQENIDSLNVWFNVNLNSKQFRNFQKHQSRQYTIEQQFPIYILIGIIAVVLLVIITISILLIKFILKK